MLIATSEAPRSAVPGAGPAALPDGSIRDGHLATRPGQLCWYAWPGEDCFALFDGGTGLTHLLNGFPAATLRMLCAGPTSLESLALRLAALWGVEADPEWRVLVQESVDGLASLQLVENVTSSD